MFRAIVAIGSLLALSLGVFVALPNETDPVPVETEPLRPPLPLPPPPFRTSRFDDLHSLIRRDYLDSLNWFPSARGSSAPHRIYSGHRIGFEDNFNLCPTFTCTDAEFDRHAAETVGYYIIWDHTAFPDDIAGTISRAARVLKYLDEYKSGRFNPKVCTADHYWLGLQGVDEYANKCEAEADLASLCAGL